MGKDAKFVVRLSVSERLSLEKLLSQARAAKAKLLRARMLLKADADGPAWSDPAIAEAFDVSLSTVHRLRERFVSEGFDAALDRKPFCRTKPRVLDGAKEARLIATACSAPPEGQAQWTMPLLADKLVGPYTGRAMTPLATVDLVGWDIHRAIVDNVYANTNDEAHATNRLPEFMAKLMAKGVLGNKSGAGFFKKDGKKRLVLDPATGDYKPEAEIKLPELPFISEVAAFHRDGRYREGMQVFLNAKGEHAKIARKVIAGYVAYAFARVGEVSESIDGIDRIMGLGFNAAPPSVLVDTIGARGIVRMIEEAGLAVPAALADAAQTGEPKQFFNHARINIGRFFVAE